jgi:hypothetical protein
MHAGSTREPPVLGYAIDAMFRSRAAENDDDARPGEGFALIRHGVVNVAASSCVPMVSTNSGRVIDQSRIVSA